MKSNVQWQVETTIEAPVAKVWEAIEDLTLIPSYHPEVGEVDFLSGQTRRAPGVSYKCIVSKGLKGWCVEKVVEHIPMAKTSVSIPEDSWGLGKMFKDFLAEITVTPKEDGATTLVMLYAYYHPKGPLMRLINTLLLRRIMQKRAHQTFTGLKKMVESS